MKWKICRDGNIHAFEIVNTEWVPEDVVLGKPRILGAAKMVAKCFLKNKAPFQCNKKTRPIKLKSTDQRFGLGYKPKKDDYKRVVHIRKEARMARIEGRELEEEEFVTYCFKYLS